MGTVQSNKPRIEDDTKKGIQKLTFFVNTTDDGRAVKKVSATRGTFASRTKPLTTHSIKAVSTHLALYPVH